jgi:hypothetical protein
MSHLEHWPDVKSALSAHPVFHEGVGTAAEYALVHTPISTLTHPGILMSLMSLCLSLG